MFLVLMCFVGLEHPESASDPMSENRLSCRTSPWSNCSRRSNDGPRILNDWHTCKADADWKHRAHHRAPPGLAPDVFCILMVNWPVVASLRSRSTFKNVERRDGELQPKCSIYRDSRMETAYPFGLLAHILRRWAREPPSEEMGQEP